MSGNIYPSIGSAMGALGLKYVDLMCIALLLVLPVPPRRHDIPHRRVLSQLTAGSVSSHAPISARL